MKRPLTALTGILAAAATMAGGYIALPSGGEEEAVQQVDTPAPTVIALPTLSSAEQGKPVVIPWPLEPPPFQATGFVSDVVIPSKRAIQIVGWSPDSQHLAYTSIDPALNLPPGMEQLYSTDLTGTVITEEGLVARPSWFAPLESNPQIRSAAAWKGDGMLVKQTAAAGALGVASTTAEAATVPVLPLYSIPVDRSSNTYVRGADGSWRRDDGSAIAQLTSPVDEGAFSVSPDGAFVTYAHDRTDGQRDLVLTDAVGTERVVATAPFVAVDGWKADSSAFALRTGSRARHSWLTDVAWFVLSTGQTHPVAEGLNGLGFAFQVIPSPANAGTYIVGVAPLGAGAASLEAWYLTADSGASFSRFGVRAAGSAAWSSDGASIAYTTGDESGTGTMQLHIARLK